MNIKLVFVLVLIEVVLATDRGKVCLTPNGEQARCVPAKECQIILDGITSQNSSLREFIQKSQCGYDGEFLVCCGTSLTYKTRHKILTNFKYSTLSNKTICGLEHEENRIIFGELTDIEEFPWMAALWYKRKITSEDVGVKCGGSIITNRYVVTAAHCLDPVAFTLFKVGLGEWKISTDPDCQKLVANTECADPVKYMNIEAKIAHPKYDIATSRNDIGLLRLKEDIPYTKFIRPICLPNAELPEPELDSIMTVAGWGATENSKSSDIKLKVGIPLKAIDICTKLLPVALTENQLCAGGAGKKDSCRGDSGGPLMRTFKNADTQKEQFYLEGVVSWGDGCGRPGIPAVYTRVSKYMTWLAETVSQGQGSGKTY